MTANIFCFSLIIASAFGGKLSLGLLDDASNSDVNVIKVRGVFQKYAERFHRMFAIAARLMIFHVKYAWYMFIK